jgi:hypothetical protein
MYIAWRHHSVCWLQVAIFTTVWPRQLGLQLHRL